MQHAIVYWFEQYPDGRLSGLHSLHYLSCEACKLERLTREIKLGQEIDARRIVASTPEKKPTINPIMKTIDPPVLKREAVPASLPLLNGNLEADPEPC